MIGKTLLHYRITEKLGEGGMGVVYRAEDTRLKRDVAIKFLPGHLAADASQRQRLATEARAAAALNHPNIAHVHAIEESDGVMFIVMEYVSGRELRELVGTDALSLDRATEIATQIASGLKSAHDKGIVHRDIKSANILVTDDGQVKIMDFGLAKMLGNTRVTKTGVTVGTPDYMSPEQVRGEDVDQRTDIWSFGVVLFEMLTGQRPFRGDYEQAVMYAIANEDAPSASMVAPGLPAAAVELVRKTLERDRNARCASMADVISALQSLSNASATDNANHRDRRKSDTKKSLPGLAVLPFDSIRRDPEMDFLGFALADQIIGALTYVDSIVVRPSSSVRKYQNQPVDVPAAGADLHADFVLIGHYLKEADTIRLNVELISTPSNDLVWRESIEVKYENTFKLQDMVAKKVLRGLKVQFSRAAQQAIQADVPGNPLAYEYYLRAVSYSTTLADNRLAIQMLEKSIKLDGSYAPAHAEMGYRLGQDTNYGMVGGLGYRQMEDAFRRALSLNPNHPGALSNLCLHYIDFGKHEEATDLIRRMLTATPNSATAHFALGYLCRYTGMNERSVAEVEKALELDPRNTRFRSGGFNYIYAGDYRKAYEAFQLDGKSAPPIAWQGLALFLLGDRESAFERLDRAVAMDPAAFVGQAFVVLKAFIAGDRAESLRAILKLDEAMKGIEVDAENWYIAGKLHGLLGAKEGCARSLTLAIEGGFFNYPYMLVDPFLDPVRDEPEVRAALALARAKHEKFKQAFTRMMP